MGMKPVSGSLQTSSSRVKATMTKDGLGEKSSAYMWDMIGMSLSHCTGGINGVGTGLSRVCVELLTPVTAACFDVYFNVVLCCSLCVYVLIKKET